MGSENIVTWLYAYVYDVYAYVCVDVHVCVCACGVCVHASLWMKVTAIDRLQSYKSVVTQNYNNLMALAQRQFALSMVQSA